MQPEHDSFWAMRLRHTWAWLGGLTLLSLAIVLGTGRMESGLPAAAAASLLSYYKARLLLDHFLDLRQSPAPWRMFFHGMIAAILALVLVAYAIPALIR